METADDRVGFVWGGDSRSTVMLLWSCLITIFACTWTVIHLNMPAPYESIWSIAGSKVAWLVVTVVFPEFTLFVASQQHDHCINFTNIMKKTCASWTISHSYFAMMGGYMLRFENNVNYNYRDPTPHSISESWACFWRGRCKHWQAPSLATWRLSLEDIDRLRALDLQSSFQIPELSEKDIKDRGMTDSFAKLFTSAQVGWMIIQVSARGVENLPISELEIITYAYVFMALWMYFCWWHKPYGAQIPVIIPFEGDPVPLLDKDKTNMRFNRRTNMVFLGSNKILSRRAITWSCIFATALGGMHFLAWGFSFATQKEEEMWKICSIVVTVLPAIVCCNALCYYTIKLDVKGWMMKIVGTALGFTSLTYVAARAILLFQAFYCLRSMPAKTYITAAWIDYIPHAG